MPAQCGHCGGTVMRWRRYFWYMRTTAECRQCGKRVRLERWPLLAAVAVTLLGGFVATLVFVESRWTSAAIFAALAVLAIVFDWWSWKIFRWAPIADVPEAD